MLALGRAVDAEAQNVPLVQIAEATSILDLAIPTATRIIFTHLERAMVGIVSGVACVIAIFIVGGWQLGLVALGLGCLIVTLAGLDDLHTFHSTKQSEMEAKQLETQMEKVW